MGEELKIALIPVAVPVADPGIPLEMTFLDRQEVQGTALAGLRQRVAFLIQGIRPRAEAHFHAKAGQVELVLPCLNEQRPAAGGERIAVCRVMQINAAAKAPTTPTAPPKLASKAKPLPKPASAKSGSGSEDWESF